MRSERRLPGRATRGYCCLRWGLGRSGLPPWRSLASRWSPPAAVQAAMTPAASCCRRPRPRSGSRSPTSSRARHRRRAAGGRLVRDPAAERQAADRLRDRQRAAHRRAPAVRARRPVDDHPPPPAGQPRRHVDDKVTFKEPGRYRVVVDAYPKTTGSLKNFQLFRFMDVAGAPPRRCRRSRHPEGRRVHVHDGGLAEAEGGRGGAAEGHGDRPGGQAGRVHALVRRARPRDLLPPGSLDYFHTHVCAPGATGCTSQLGGASVTGTSATPGELRSASCCRSPAPGGCSSRPRWAARC